MEEKFTQFWLAKGRPILFQITYCAIFGLCSAIAEPENEAGKINMAEDISKF